MQNNSTSSFSARLCSSVYFFQLYSYRKDGHHMLWYLNWLFWCKHWSGVEFVLETAFNTEHLEHDRWKLHEAGCSCFCCRNLSDGLFRVHPPDAASYFHSAEIRSTAMAIVTPGKTPLVIPHLSSSSKRRLKKRHFLPQWAAGDRKLLYEASSVCSLHLHGRRSAKTFGQLRIHTYSWYSYVFANICSN